uniref:30S ribosomal protein S15 n=2 Tax=Corethron hystrix TaxID=216773 RepID=A0A7S1G342_9STRA|mmetsp:Transcript_9828/g.21901  ORF Transcript_9828/g.21901 Transcript_9828/m.21901 type:complete len:206 (+) Transcript_9828:215-832(+)
MEILSRFGFAVSALAAVSCSVDAFTCPSQSHGQNAMISGFSRSNIRARVSFLPVTMSQELEDMLTDDGEEEPDDYILESNELDASEDTESEPSSSYTHSVSLDEIRKKWARAENDSGSPEFQIAGMTERIMYLTKHMQQNPKDFSTRRGLLALVNKRRRLLNYLFRVNQDKYVEIIASLGIRHKAPGRVMTREEVYGRFSQRKKK